MKIYAAALWTTILLTAWAGCPAVAVAQNAAAGETAEASGGRYQVSPFLWASGIEGDVGVGSLTVPVEVEFSELVENLEGGLMLYGRATWGRWSLGLEGVWMELGSEPTPTELNLATAEVEFEQILIDAQVAYAVVDRPTFRVDLIGGAKYNRITVGLKSEPNPAEIAGTSAAITDEIGRRVRGSVPSPQPPGALPPSFADAIKELLDRFGPGVVEDALDALRGEARSSVNRAVSDALTSAVTQDIEETQEWVDPYVGARAHWGFQGPWYVVGRGDIGGFGVGSDLTWQVYGGLGCQLARYASVELGYRHLDVDYSDDQFAADIAYSGPMLGARFMF